MAYREGLDVIPIGEDEPDPSGTFTLAGYNGGRQLAQVAAKMDTSREYSGTPEIFPGLQLDQVKLYRFVHSQPMSGGSSGGGAFWRGKQYGVISAGNDPRESITACAADLVKFARRAKQVCRNGSCRMVFFFPRNPQANRKPAKPGQMQSPASGNTGRPVTQSPLRPIAHPATLPPPVVDDSQPDAAPPAPELPGLTQDFLRSELARLEANLKGHTSQEADRLGGIAIGGLSNAKDTIISKIKDPATAADIAKSLGSPDAQALARDVASQVIAGLPAGPAKDVAAAAESSGLLSGLAGTLGFNALLGAPAGPPGMLLTALLGVGGFLFQRVMKGHTAAIVTAVNQKQPAAASAGALGSGFDLGTFARTVGDAIQKRIESQINAGNAADNSQLAPPPPPAATGAECPPPEHRDAPPPQIVPIKVADPLGMALQDAMTAVLKKNPAMSLLEAQPAIQELAQELLKIRLPFTGQPASTALTAAK